MFQHDFRCLKLPVNTMVLVFVPRVVSVVAIFCSADSFYLEYLCCAMLLANVYLHFW